MRLLTPPLLVRACSTALPAAWQSFASLINSWVLRQQQNQIITPRRPACGFAIHESASAQAEQRFVDVWPGPGQDRPICLRFLKTKWDHDGDPQFTETMVEMKKLPNETKTDVISLCHSLKYPLWVSHGSTSKTANCAGTCCQAATCQAVPTHLPK